MLWLPILAVVLLLTGWRLQFPIAKAQKIPLLLSLYGLIPLLLWGFAHFIDGVSPAQYGLSWGFSFWRSVAVGFALGVGGIALLLGIKLGAGWLRWLPAGPAAAPAKALLQGGLPIGLLALLISGIEEAVFRGFVVHQLQSAYGWVAVVVLASALFAVLHLVWDGPAGLPQQPGLWLMGAVLILARWADGGRLGLPIGLHAGWIFTLALLDLLRWTVPTEGSPCWLAGRVDQPLTGLVDVLLLLTTAAGLWAFA